MASVTSSLPRTSGGAPVLQGASTLPPMNQAVVTQAKHETQKRSAKKKTADRFSVLNGFVDCSMAGLTKVELATWLCLYRDTRNGTANVTQAAIATRTGTHIRSVRRALKKLRQAGLLTIVYQGGLNRGASTYRVEALRTLPPKALRTRVS